FGKPRCDVGAGRRPVRLPITFDHLCAVLPDSLAEVAGAGVWGILLPALSKQPDPADRERLAHRLLEPLAGHASLRIQLPAVAQDMTKLVAELIGKLGPVPGGDVDDNPG